MTREELSMSIASQSQWTHIRALLDRLDPAGRFTPGCVHLCVCDATWIGGMSLAAQSALVNP
jgi:hypothetical protein